MRETLQSKATAEAKTIKIIFKAEHNEWVLGEKTPTGSRKENTR